MKKNLSSIELHFLLPELKQLVDQRIDKIYHPTKQELVIQFHVTGKGKRILRLIAGKFIYFTQSKEPADNPSGFCMFLRKHLSNARLKSVHQLESERIVQFTFENKEGAKNLMVELFSEGNFIVTDDKNIILSAIEFHTWKDREVRVRLPYEYPKRKYNIFQLAPDDLKDVLENSSKENTVKALAVDLGFGGTYSEEVCLIAGIDKNKKPDAKDAPKLCKAVSELLTRKMHPMIVDEDVVPIELAVYTSPQQEFSTYSEALDAYLTQFKDFKKSPKEKQMEKLSRIIETQKKKIGELGQQELGVRAIGEQIYQNYALIAEILTEVNKASEKHSWKEIQEKLKGHKIIKSINTKDKKAMVEI